MINKGVVGERHIGEGKKIQDSEGKQKFQRPPPQFDEYLFPSVIEYLWSMNEGRNHDVDW